MIQRPSQEEIEKGLAEFKGDSKEDIDELKRTIRPHIVDLIYVLILDEKDLNDDEPWEDAK